MRNRIPGWIVFVLSTLIVVAVFVQAYLITAYVTGNRDALDAHGLVGFITHLVEVVVFLVALWAWWGNYEAVVASCFAMALCSFAAFMLNLAAAKSGGSR